MKKLILILSVAFVACGPRADVNNKEVAVHGGTTVNEYTIEGCQYIGNLDNGYNAHYLTHKGNCNNPIHSK